MIAEFVFWLRRQLLNFVKPILVWAADKHLPYTHKKVSGVDYYNIYPLLKPGVVFLTQIHGDLTTLLISGEWTHAALYAPCSVGPVDESVVEAVGVGVADKDLVSFLTSKDGVLVLEPSYLGDKKQMVMDRAAEIARSHIGRPYDYQFEFQISEQKAFYCSELVWYAYDQACQEFGVPLLFTPRLSLGIPTVTPEDIANAKDKFTVLWDTRKHKDALK